MGYEQFKPGHFVWLEIMVFFVIFYSLICRHADLPMKVILLRSVGAALILSDVLKVFILARSDVKFTDYLPPDACSFDAYFVVLDSIRYDNPFFLQMLLVLFLPATITVVINFDVVEKDVTTYAFRRNYATRCHNRLSRVQIEYLMGHKLSDIRYQRSDFVDEDFLYEMYNKLRSNPVNSYYIGKN